MSILTSIFIDNGVSIVNNIVTKAVDYQMNQERLMVQSEFNQLYKIQNEQRIIAQFIEGNANRSLQRELHKKNSILSLYKDELNRQFQHEIKLLDIKQQELNREQAERLNSLRLKIQIWAVQKQRDLQLLLQEKQHELNKEISNLNRKTQLEVIREGKRFSKLPINIDLEQILKRKYSSGLRPIHIFYSPPIIRDDNDRVKSIFPKISHNLEIALASFLRYFENNNRPITFFSGAWESKKYYGQSAAEALFVDLKSEATLILDNYEEGGNYFIHLSSWFDNPIKPRFDNMVEFRWQEVLNKLVNKEPNKGKEDFINYITILNLFFIGFKIDEYYLFNSSPQKKLQPILPDLLLTLLSTLSKEDEYILINEIIIPSYNQLYEEIAKLEKGWFPEIKLQLSQVLIKLKKIEEAKQELINSITGFLSNHSINEKIDSIDKGIEVLPVLIQKKELEYLQDLQQNIHNYPKIKNTTIQKFNTYMKNQQRLALKIIQKNQSYLIKDGTPSILGLHLETISKKQKKMLAQKEFGKKDLLNPKHKVILLVGATGTGKTTLINGMINYILGVKWKDNFRFEMIQSKDGKSQVHSQTDYITSYHIHQIDNSKVPFNVTIIDTPGFGDTRGLERDKKIIYQIQDFFNEYKDISAIDMIGFVVKSPAVRVGIAEKYVYDAILSIFDKNIANNIWALVNFSDGSEPPVIEALKDRKVPFNDYFEFNNSALYVQNNEKKGNFKKFFWTLGKKSFKRFFKELSKTVPVPLEGTKEVLKERQKLEAVILGLRPKINEGLMKIEELRKLKENIKNNKSEIERNKNYEYTDIFTEPRTKFTDTNTTTCLECETTCHKDCAYDNNDDKRKCYVMNDDGYCNVCHHHWTKHTNLPFIYYREEVKKTIRSEDLYQKYKQAVEGKTKAEVISNGLLNELRKLEKDVFLMMMQVKGSLARLDEIALKPNPLTSEDYLQQLIDMERREKKKGYEERIIYYNEALNLASLIEEINSIEKIEDIKIFEELRKEEPSENEAIRKIQELLNTGWKGIKGIKDFFKK